MSGQKKSLVRIFFADGLFKTFSLDDTVTALEFNKMISKKYQIEHSLCDPQRYCVYEYWDLGLEVYLIQEEDSYAPFYTLQWWASKPTLQPKCKLVHAAKSVNSAHLSPQQFRTPNFIGSRVDYEAWFAKSSAAYPSRVALPSRQEMTRETSTPKPALQRQPSQEKLMQVIVCLEWANSILASRKISITDIVEDMRSGALLVFILEDLTNLKIQPMFPAPVQKENMITNLNTCLKFLQLNGCEITGCIGEDLFYGNQSVWVRLFGLIMKHYSTASSAERQMRRSSIIKRCSLSSKTSTTATGTSPTANPATTEVSSTPHNNGTSTPASNTSTSTPPASTTPIHLLSLQLQPPSSPAPLPPNGGTSRGLSCSLSSPPPRPNPPPHHSTVPSPTKTTESVSTEKEVSWQERERRATEIEPRLRPVEHTTTQATFVSRRPSQLITPTSSTQESSAPDGLLRIVISGEPGVFESQTVAFKYQPELKMHQLMKQVCAKKMLNPDEWCFKFLNLDITCSMDLTLRDLGVVSIRLCKKAQGSVDAADLGKLCDEFDPVVDVTQVSGSQWNSSSSSQQSSHDDGGGSGVDDLGFKVTTYSFEQVADSEPRDDLDDLDTFFNRLSAKRALAPHHL
ncbi:hypothetical protein Pelo_11653 [Pelomyxa schiedti]|nr:hypothetical protein Pelo_11653 [Pelomyxa schiedti]